MARYADALDAYRDELARLLTLEQGKPLHSQATFETDLALSWVRSTANVSSLVPILFDAAYGHSGQWCIAVRRLYVHESLHRQFVDEFVAHAPTKKVGRARP